jgi:hypothetical protein
MRLGEQVRVPVMVVVVEEVMVVVVLVIRVGVVEAVLVTPILPDKPWYKPPEVIWRPTPLMVIMFIPKGTPVMGLAVGNMGWRYCGQHIK